MADLQFPCHVYAFRGRHPGIQQGAEEFYGYGLGFQFVSKVNPNTSIVGFPHDPWFVDAKEYVF